MIKVAHSGSTWLASLLSKMPYSSCRGEAIRMGSVKPICTAIGKEKMADAVVDWMMENFAGAEQPAARMAQSKLAKQLHLRDANKAPKEKPGECSAACASGFSTEGVGLLSFGIDEILQRVLSPDTNSNAGQILVIVLLRSNSVKKSLAHDAAKPTGKRGRRLDGMAKYAGDPKAMLEHVLDVNTKTRQIGSYIPLVRSIPGAEVIPVFYEDLQRNVTHELRRIADALGLDAAIVEAMPASLVSPQKANSGKWHSDDLKSAMGSSHYEAALSYFQQHAPCFVEQLQATGPKKFWPPCCNATQRCSQREMFAVGPTEDISRGVCR